MKILKSFIWALSFALCALGLIGCATAPYAPSPKPEMGISGIYHRVQKGETLWRISKIYDVDLDEIVKINRISDATSIETGQLVFIPHRQKQYAAYRAPSHLDEFIWPIKGRVICTFGSSCNNMINKGINIQPYSTYDVVASRDGKVIFYTDNFQGYGKTIIIDHGDGFSTVYSRNSQVFIRAGETVRKGNLIAKVGSAGKDKNTYLHFQVRKGNAPKNPYFYLSRY